MSTKLHYVQLVFRVYVRFFNSANNQITARPGVQILQRGDTGESESEATQRRSQIAPLRSLECVLILSFFELQQEGDETASLGTNTTALSWPVFSRPRFLEAR